MNPDTIFQYLFFAFIFWMLAGDIVKAIAVGVFRAVRPRALEEPETDDNGYIIDPARAAQIDLLEEVCQIGEYAPGESKHKCQHEWINGVCFWCEAHEQPHRPRKFARNATPAELAEAMKPMNPVETLEAILAEPDPESAKKQAAMRVATQFVSNGRARVVKNVLDDMNVRRVVDLREDQIEPFVRRLASIPLD